MWLPEEYWDVTDIWEIIELLKTMIPDVLHPMAGKYALMEWAKLADQEVTEEMVRALGVVRGM